MASQRPARALSPRRFTTRFSYASADAALARIVVANLERAGLTCWIAPRDVQPGTPYAAVFVGWPTPHSRAEWSQLESSRLGQLVCMARRRRAGRRAAQGCFAGAFQACGVCVAGYGAMDCAMTRAHGCFVFTNSSMAWSMPIAPLRASALRPVKSIQPSLNPSIICIRGAGFLMPCARNSPSH